MRAISKGDKVHMTLAEMRGIPGLDSIALSAITFASVSAACMALLLIFGFRNLANYDAGLREIFRVLKPQGEVGILDFSEPGGVLGKLYGFYFRKVLPKVGTMISGVRGPYEYLPASVHKFPAPQEMLARMESVGFTDVSWTPYTFAIAGLYRGKKR